MMLMSFWKLMLHRVDQRDRGCCGATRPSSSTFQSHERGARWVRAMALLLASAAAFAASAQTINYSYDEAGRLKSVTNTINETAEYIYDAAGNLTQIRRTVANVPAVTDFRPDGGPVGTVVTISGANFNATPASNTVRFNGTLAAVSAATTTQLVTTVPADATSGPVSVQTAAGTGTSFQSFIVTGAGGGVPTITGFTPGIGLPDTVVTITGTNFATGPGQTKVYFNQSLARIQSVASGTITVFVPTSTGTGRIRVVTLAGTATSSADFVIPPPTTSGASYPIADYSGQIARLTLGGSGSVNVTVPAGTNRWALFVFDGGPDTAVTVDFTGYATTPVDKSMAWEVRDLHNEFMTSDSFEVQNIPFDWLSPNKRSIHIPPMPFFGTYAVVLKPSGAALTGASVTAVLRADSELVVDGAAANFVSAFPGQMFRYIFKGITGVPLGEAVQGLSMTPSNNGGISLSFRQPDWHSVSRPTDSNPFGGNCLQASSAIPTCDLNIDPRSLTVTGLYSFMIKPSYSNSVGGTTAASGKAWLSTDLSGTLAFGSDFDTPTHRVGQNGRYTFVGTAGQFAGLAVSNVTFAPTDPSVAAYVRLFRSDRTEVTVSGFVVTAGAGSVSSFEFPILPADDTYSVFLDPNAGASGTARLRLWNTVAANLATDGTALPVSFAQGQKGRITFTVNATSGPNLGLGLSPLAYAPSNVPDPTNVVVYQVSTNAIVASASCFSASPGGRCGLNLENLATGDYRIEITPPPNPTGTTFSLRLTPDLTPGSLTVNTAVPVSITTIGQNARLTFTGTAGQQLGLALSGMTILDNQYVSVVIRRASNNQLVTSGNVSGPTGVLDIPVLPANDTYVVYLDPEYASTGTFDVTLSADATGTLLTDGTPQTVTLNVRGQRARYTFNATAGQNLGLGLSGMSLTPSASGTAMRVIRLSTGADIKNTASCDPGAVGSGCALNLRALAADSYVVQVEPPAPTTSASFTLTLTPDSPTVTPLLTLGTPFNLTVGIRGQDGLVKFSNVAGQNRRVTVTTLATSPTGQTVNMGVLQPNGTQVNGAGLSGAGGTLDLTSLPITGDYSLFFDQTQGLTYTLTVTVTQF